jgi:hypothetical protein
VPGGGGGDGGVLGIYLLSDRRYKGVSRDSGHASYIYSEPGTGRVAK